MTTGDHGEAFTTADFGSATGVAEIWDVVVTVLHEKLREAGVRLRQMGVDPVQADQMLRRMRTEGLDALVENVLAVQAKFIAERDGDSVTYTWTTGGVEVANIDRGEVG